MFTFVRGLLILSFLQPTFCISLQSFVIPRKLYGSNVFVNLRNEGIFDRFLKNYLELLSTTFSERKLTRYCRVLSRELDKMEFKYTKRLAKHLRHLSRMYREEIKEEMTQYRQELNKPLPFRTDFIHAMNEVFTLRENLYFSDYVHDLKDYGNEDKLYINEETRKLLNNVIMGAINKISDNDKNMLEYKLKKAISEYKNSD